MVYQTLSITEEHITELESKYAMRFARGEEKYELMAAFGDEGFFTTNLFTGERTYFHYQIVESYSDGDLVFDCYKSEIEKGVRA